MASATPSLDNGERSPPSPVTSAVQRHIVGDQILSGRLTAGAPLDGGECLGVGVEGGVALAGAPSQAQVASAGDVTPADTITFGHISTKGVYRTPAEGRAGGRAGGKAGTRRGAWGPGGTNTSRLQKKNTEFYRFIFIFHIISHTKYKLVTYICILIRLPPKHNFQYFPLYFRVYYVGHWSNTSDIDVSDNFGILSFTEDL